MKTVRSRTSTAKKATKAKKTVGATSTKKVANKPKRVTVKAKAVRPALKGTARTASAAAIGKDLWAGVRAILSDAEAGLETFGHAVESAAATAESKTRKGFAQLKKGSTKSQAAGEKWIQGKIAKMTAFEKKSEKVLGTARLRAHLATLDAKYTMGRLSQQVDRVRERIDGLKVRATEETAASLQRLSEAVLSLKEQFVDR